MISVHSTSEYKGEIKTLKLTQDPLRYGHGTYTDTDGKRWDVHCVVGASYSSSGKPYVNARLESEHPHYYSTGTDYNPNGSHKWIHYYFEVINQK